MNPTVRISVSANDSSSIEVFLHLAPLVADEDHELEASDAPAPTVPVGWRRTLSEFMFNKKKSGYSSIAPRDAEGRRTTVFCFNGNGRVGGFNRARDRRLFTRNVVR
jgi:hypothetical protein